MRQVWCCLLAVACLILNGCWYCSSRVSEIGLRGTRTSGQEDGTCLVESISAEVKSYGNVYYPYSYNPHIAIGDVVDKTPGTWIKQGKTIVVTYGKDSIVRPWYEQGMLLHGGMYGDVERRWWGYPAQLMQLAAFPIDVVTWPFFFMIGTHSDVRASGVSTINDALRKKNKGHS